MYIPIEASRLVLDELGKVHANLVPPSPSGEATLLAWASIERECEPLEMDLLDDNMEEGLVDEAHLDAFQGTSNKPILPQLSEDDSHKLVQVAKPSHLAKFLVAVRGLILGKLCSVSRAKRPNKQDWQLKGKQQDLL